MLNQIPMNDKCSEVHCLSIWANRYESYSFESPSQKETNQAECWRRGGRTGCMSFSSTPWLYPVYESVGISYMQFCFVQAHAERNLIVSMDFSWSLSPSASHDAWMISYADGGLLMLLCLYIHRPYIMCHLSVYVFISAPANMYKKSPSH
jgi:hypothetical protein